MALGEGRALELMKVLIIVACSEAATGPSVLAGIWAGLKGSGHRLCLRQLRLP